MTYDVNELPEDEWLSMTAMARFVYFYHTETTSRIHLEGEDWYVASTKQFWPTYAWAWHQVGDTKQWATLSISGFYFKAWADVTKLVRFWEEKILPRVEFVWGMLFAPMTPGWK